MIAIGFPDPRTLQGAILTEIFRLNDARVIRMIVLLAMVKDPNGTLCSTEIHLLSDEERVQLASAVGAPLGFGETHASWVVMPQRR